jgi:chemotaxis protein MotB
VIKLTSHGKKAKSAHPDVEGTWAISYGDMITLLLTFFILFFNINNKKTSQDAIQSALIERLRLELGAKDMHKQAVEPSRDIAELNEIQDARVEKHGSFITIEFPKVSFFNFGKLEVTPEGIKCLKKVSDAFVPYAGTNRLVIKAFTDERPVRTDKSRPFKDNLELSVLRAVSAVRILQHAGVPLNRMKPAGFGILKLADALAKTGDPQARKVILIIEPDSYEI